MKLTEIRKCPYSWQYKILNISFVHLYTWNWETSDDDNDGCNDNYNDNFDDNDDKMTKKQTNIKSFG